MTLRIGLTGGIGSGKSTVAALFSARGRVIIDTDAIAHEITAAHGDAMPAILAAFGPTVRAADGSLDRTAMRARIFSDDAARLRLQAILHPLIERRSDAEFQAAGAVPYVLWVVPLLIELDAFRRQADRILLVDCDEATQIGRVMARSGLSADEVRKILAAQASRQQRLAAADDVIYNGADRAALAPQVDALDQHYLKIAESRLTG